VHVDLPYPNSSVEVPEANLIGVYGLPEWPAPGDAAGVVGQALGTHRPMTEDEMRLKLGEDVERVGLRYAATPQEALDEAFTALGADAEVIVLRGAAEMLPVLS
jgi:hypothetical protein